MTFASSIDVRPCLWVALTCAAVFAVSACETEKKSSSGEGQAKEQSSTEGAATEAPPPEGGDDRTTGDATKDENAASGETPVPDEGGAPMEPQDGTTACARYAAAVDSLCAGASPHAQCPTWTKSVEAFTAQGDSAEPGCASALEALDGLAGPNELQAEPPSSDHVLPGSTDRAVEDDIQKAQRVIRFTTNYLRPEVSENGAPSNQAGAEAAIGEQNKEWPKDPWGAPYVYERIDERTFTVFSTGPDGEPGTDDDVRVD